MSAGVVQHSITFPLQRLNCDPQRFCFEGMLPDFKLPLFQNLTHFEVTVNPERHTEWDWSPLRNSVTLTHLKAPVLLTPKGYSAIIENLIPGLPVSAQIIILHAGAQRPTVTEGIYNRLEIGEVDCRVILAGYNIHADWVLFIDNAMSTLEPWAASTGDILWSAATRLLKDRNSTLYPESEVH
ncbi:hypothetical protein DL96DRAFT_1585970 [Flagelloscypha sp. PMI_526]|nr:hypothetical protein DL96DRAFT_1585970 [Flagelloscypha sp. PMI_526]